MNPGRSRAILLFISMLVASGAAALVRVSSPEPVQGRSLDLEERFPTSFAGWRQDDSHAMAVVSPEIRATLSGLYTEQLSRTYVNELGQRVMLVIAYSIDQSSEVSQVHRPEICYTAQGFALSRIGDVELPGDRPLKVRRLLGERGSRYEPITYWMTMGDEAVLPGFERLRSRLRMALQRQLPDGVLVRVSTVDLQMPEAYAVQSQFVAAMLGALPPDLRRRLAGSAS